VKGSDGGFRHWDGLVISTVAASFSSPNVQTVDFASFQPLRSQYNPSRLVLGFPSALLSVYSRISPLEGNQECRGVT